MMNANCKNPDARWVYTNFILIPALLPFQVQLCYRALSESSLVASISVLSANWQSWYNEADWGSAFYPRTPLCGNYY